MNSFFLLYSFSMEWTLGLTDFEWEFTSWLLREGQNVVFAMITIATQRFPDSFGSPPSIFIIFVSLNSY